MGDGTNATVFTDTAKQVFWSAKGTPNYVFRVNANSSATFGNSGQKDGVYFFVNNSGNHMINNRGTVSCYGCMFKATANWKLISFNTMENCLIDGFDLTPDGQGVSQQNLNLLNCPSDGIRNPSGTTDNVVSLNSRKYGVTFYTNTVNEATVTNLNIKNAATSSFQINSAANCNFYLTNPVVDSWTIIWVGTTTNTKLHRQYTFDLQVCDNAESESQGTVVPIEGADVTLYDKDGNEVFNTTSGADGWIATQTVSRGYYAQSTGDTLQDYGPHFLLVTKDGYEPYMDECILTEKRTNQISMNYPGVPADTATATPTDVLASKTFFGKTGTLETGTSAGPGGGGYLYIDRPVVKEVIVEKENPVNDTLLALAANLIQQKRLLKQEKAQEQLKMLKEKKKP